MIIRDKQYKIHPGEMVVGGSPTCQIIVPNLDNESFKLNYNDNLLWIQPLTMMIRINGFNESIQLQQHKEYEIDLSTGSKSFVLNNQVIEFVLTMANPKPKFKIKIVEPKQVIQQETAHEPETVKKVKLNQDSQVNQYRRKYPLTQAKISSISMYKIKLSNCTIGDQDICQIYELGMELGTESDYNILVMDQLKRTFSLLHAVNSGRIVVNSIWLKNSIVLSKIQNPYEYILRSNKVHLKGAIESAIQRPLFTNMRFIVRNQEELELTERVEGSMGMDQIVMRQQVVHNREECRWSHSCNQY